MQTQNTFFKMFEYFKLFVSSKFSFRWHTDVVSCEYRLWLYGYKGFSSDWKTFNWYTVVCKICPRYIRGIIKRLLKFFNCRVKEECQMDCKCQTKDRVYECFVMSPELKRIYLMLAEEWKKRFLYYNYKKLFNHKWNSQDNTFKSYLCSNWKKI